MLKTTHTLTLTYVLHCCFNHNKKVSRDSVVGIATRYVLDGPGFESRWGGEIFRTRPDRL